jgi:hypothetical protein
MATVKLIKTIPIGPIYLITVTTIPIPTITPIQIIAPMQTTIIAQTTAI